MLLKAAQSIVLFKPSRGIEIHRENRAHTEVITPAERRVLLVLLQGCSNQDIAKELVLSIRTVESHISNLLAKTGCSNRSQLLLWAMGEG